MKTMSVMAAALLIGTVAHAEMPQFSNTTPYPVVRQFLFKHGWTPVTMHAFGHCGWDASACPKMMELDMCFEGAESGCSFAWRKGHEFIEIYGRGEGDPEYYARTVACKKFSNDPKNPQALYCVK